MIFEVKSKLSVLNAASMFINPENFFLFPFKLGYFIIAQGKVLVEKL